MSVLPKYNFISNDRVAKFHSFVILANDDKLCFDYEFEEEQEYSILIRSDALAQKRLFIETSVYALEEDLYNRKVLKGDLHMHTTYSDGLESVEHRIATARKIGMDFIAITDHNGYVGSLRSLEVLAKCFINMFALHGEEVHADNTPVHILALGAKTAIAPLVINRSPVDEEKIRLIMDQFRGKLSDKVDLYSFASSIDVFNKIKSFEGISVLCHIYWDAVKKDERIRMGAPEPLIDALVDHCMFDVFEITSGAPSNDMKANYLQDIYYRERLPKGFPIIGITDSHTTLKELGSIFGHNFTVAFVETCDEAGLLQAILDYKTISVDALVSPICHGSLRLSKYTTFLLSEYFPRHDEIVSIEGQEMDRILLGKSGMHRLKEKSEENFSLLEFEWGVILPKM
ncbi:MAG: PHP domain-containing protein [Erysipelothrix sp.]|nr:PHP domain-containing protein [Erysipelothrix sp.]